MRLGNRMKRLTQRDLEELGAASVKLSSAAATIQSTKANYVPAVIQLLREANDTIVGIRDRALTTVKRIVEREEDRLDALAEGTKAEDNLALAGWPGSDSKPKE